jgi:hypothetical protein
MVALMSDGDGGKWTCGEAARGDKWTEKLAAKGRTPTEGERGRAVGRLRMDLPGLMVLLLMMMARAAVGDVIPDLRIDWDMMVVGRLMSEGKLVLEVVWCGGWS